MPFPERLRHLRNSRGMSQEELGKVLSLDKSTISLYESGRREPGHATLESLARFFDVTVDYLLGRTDVAGPIVSESISSYESKAVTSSIGARIRQARAERGVSRAQLAKRLRKTARDVLLWEQEEQKISIDDLNRVSEALDTPLPYFLNETGTPRIPSASMHGIVRASVGDFLGVVYLPVIGTVAAGEPLLAVENIETYVPFPKELAGSADCALRVRGDSMIEAGIESGDFVLIKQARETTENGQIVVALLDGELFTTLKMLHQDGEGRWWLKGANRDFKDTPVDPSRVQVLGVYAGVFKPPKK